MSNLNKEVIYHKEGFVIIKDTIIEVPPISCDVCNFFMKSLVDSQSWREHQCCRECAITWAEGLNKKKWLEGWRPSKKAIRLEVEKRTKIVSRLKL
jgi:hypothetical protein